MANLANYTQIAQLVKGWAEELMRDADDPGTVNPIAQDMLAFSNGLAHTVEMFGPIVAELNKFGADGNDDFVMVPVANCRRYTSAHKPHIYDDHGNNFACWGQGPNGEWNDAACGGWGHCPCGATKTQRVGESARHKTSCPAYLPPMAPEEV